MAWDQRPVYIPRDVYRALPWYSWAGLIGVTAATTAALWYAIPIFFRIVQWLGHL